MINPKYKNVFFIQGGTGGSGNNEEQNASETSEKYVPSMQTVGSKLRKMFNTPGQTVESALPKSMALELYVDGESNEPVAYRDLELTEKFASEEEAIAALKSAIAIKVNFIEEGGIAYVEFPIGCSYVRPVIIVRTESGDILIRLAIPA